MTDSKLSVPFSSGHRLLLGDFYKRSRVISSFQSPFHRGIGCYLSMATVSEVLYHFQSPFHRGIGCYYKRYCQRMNRVTLSVPFSSGHRLLHIDDFTNVETAGELSVPFSSGHRLLPDSFSIISSILSFQSPFHRGIGCYSVF